MQNVQDSLIGHSRSCSEQIQQARASFPRGLIQPETSLHFGMDTLFLASFCDAYVPKHILRIGELGSGCGACLIALALLRENLCGIGFEKDADLCLASTRNCANLGFSERLHFLNLDIADKNTLKDFSPPLPCICANPPFFSPFEGRKSKSSLRNSAMRLEDSLSLFFQAAALLLPYHGYFACIYPAHKVESLLSICQTYSFGLRVLLPLAPYEGMPAKRCIILARKDAEEDCSFLPTLFLHTKTCNRTWSDAAKAFCPFL